MAESENQRKKKYEKASLIISIVALVASASISGTALFYTWWEQNIRLRPWVGFNDYNIINIRTEKAGWLGQQTTQELLQNMISYNNASWGNELQIQVQFIFENYGSTPSSNTIVKCALNLDELPKSSDLSSINSSVAVVMPTQKIYLPVTIPISMFQGILAQNKTCYALVRIDYSFSTSLLPGNGYYQLSAIILPYTLILKELAG